MTDAAVKVRLYGGPYDGDRGLIDAVVPRLWAFPCPCGELCAVGGVHWAEIYDEIPDGVVGAPYDYDEDGQDKNGFHVYVWPDMLDRAYERATAEALKDALSGAATAWDEWRAAAEEYGRELQRFVDWYRSGCPNEAC